MTRACAPELLALQVRDIDLTGRRCQVLGKGNKRRSVYFGATCARALWRYLAERKDPPGDAPLFLAERGRTKDEGLRRTGLAKLIARLGVLAGVEQVRCSPHTFRHTFAVMFLRNGGNSFTLKELLGHSSMAITNRYVLLAQADLEAQHRAYSPADRLHGRGR